MLIDYSFGRNHIFKLFSDAFRYQLRYSFFLLLIALLLDRFPEGFKMHFYRVIWEIVGGVGIVECIILLLFIGEGVSVVKLFLSKLLDEGLCVYIVLAFALADWLACFFGVHIILFVIDAKRKISESDLKNKKYEIDNSHILEAAYVLKFVWMLIQATNRYHTS